MVRERVTEHVERISLRSWRCPVQVKDWETPERSIARRTSFYILLSLLCFSYNDGVGRNPLFQKLPDDRNQIQMPFQARDAARQAQGEFPLQFRIGHEPAREPFPGGGVGRVILVRGNSIGYDSDMVRRGGRIMVKDVVPDAVGDGDHPLSPAHDGGVPVDGVEAVNAGDEAGTVFRRELFPCQVACPRRNAGMEMQDIRPDGLKQGAEGPDAEESGDAFLPIGIRMWREPSFPDGAPGVRLRKRRYFPRPGKKGRCPVP